MQTIEGGTVGVVIPNAAVAVGPGAVPAGLRFGPNPARAGSEIRFARGGSARCEVWIFDLHGRNVARVPLEPAGDSSAGVWSGRDGHGKPLEPGIYLARLTSGERLRLVILPAR